MQNPGSDAGVFVLVSSSHPPAKNAPSIRLGPCIGGGDDLAEQPDEFTVSAGGAPFQGNVGNLFWGGITGPRYFVDPKEKLVGIVFAQGPSIRAAYHAKLRAMVYGAMTSSKDDK
jgi:CubicO group peptidase (beta-lactamase class C family)